jgi:hypothetical protein
LYAQVTAWENLLEAYRKASRGKRGKPAAATFEHQVADRLLALQAALRGFTYAPGPYTHFTGSVLLFIPITSASSGAT